MSTKRSLLQPRWLVLGAAALLAGWAIQASAVDSEQPPTTPPGQAAKPQEKMLTFEMRDKPWMSVLEWLADETGLPYMGQHHPTGSFTFISSKGREQKYTVPEIIDFLNEGLAQQKYLLIRRERSFTMVPADEKVPPDILPHLTLEELSQHGNTEIAQVVLPLRALVADDTEKEVRRMLGPFGEVVALSGPNQLLVTDTVKNIKNIRKIIEGMESMEKGDRGTFEYPCKYVLAADAAKTLKELMPDPLELWRKVQPQPQFPFGGLRGGGGSGGQQQMQQQAAAQQPAINLPKRLYYISADERTNKVMVVGPADMIARAKEILTRLDEPRPGQQPVIVGGEPTIKQYSLPGGNAEAIAKVLQEVYKSSTDVRISPVGNTSIMVYARPEVQFQIAKQILGSKEAGGGTQFIRLSVLDANKTVETLQHMFGEAKGGAPYLEADTARNGVIVKGSADQLADVQAALKALGEKGLDKSGGQGGSDKVRVITLEGGSAAAMAEALQRMLQQMGQNPVKVITPGESQEQKKPAPQPEQRQPERPPATKPTNTRTAWDGSQDAAGDYRLVAQQLVDPQQPPPAKSNQQSKKPPVVITAVGNRLIITSDDPDALDMVQDLVRLLTQTPSGEGPFEVIRLKNASATEAAKVLDQAYNGTKPQSQQQQIFPFFNQFGGRPPAAPTKDRIRVVADPASNSLLIKATPLDMLEIRRLLASAIDSGETDSSAVLKTWVIPVKYASASEVAEVIRNVYRESMNNNPQGGVVGFRGGRFGGFGGRFGGPVNQNVGPDGEPRGVSLSVGVEDRTNRLVLNCSEAMFKDVEKLVKELDAAAMGSNRTVKVMSIKGIDPLLVQQAIDAIQGRRTTTNTQQTPGNFRGNGFGNPFGNGSGMNRGQGPPGGGTGMGNSGGGGSRFFVQGVKDDPGPSLLYDPQHDSASDFQATASEQPDQGSVDAVAYQQPPAGTPPASSDIRGPRGQVTAEALPELGVIVISGPTAADVEEVVNIINTIMRLAAGAEVEIRLVPLRFGDATSISNTLTQLYQRVSAGPSGNVARPGAPIQTTTAVGPAGAFSTSSQQVASVVLLPLPRFNSILVAAPKVRIPDVIREIERLDQPVSGPSRAVAFPLKRASAARVDALLTTFYAQRYPTESAGQNQVRITHEDTTNTVFVQAAPADLDDIRQLIERIDTSVSNTINELRVVLLRNALSDELAALLTQAVAEGVAAPVTTPTPSIIPTAAGVGAARGIGAGPGAALPGAALPGAAAPVAPAAAPAAAPSTGIKGTTLRFIEVGPRGRVTAESGLLEDIRITSIPRINSLLLSAPPKTMELILALVQRLDVPPALRAEIKVFTMKKADANAIATMLSQLFLGAAGAAPTTGAPGGITPTGGGIGGGGIGGGGLGGGGLGGTGLGFLGGGGAGLGGAGGAQALPTPTAPFSGAAGVPRTPFTLGPTTPEGAPLIPISMTVDQRTNSLLIGGSRNDLNVIEAMIATLEDTDVQSRTNEVYALRNAAAADVATALQSFLTQSIQVLSVGQQLSAFQEIQRSVIVVPEPVTNKLLVSATPQYFAEINRLITELDAQPPMVVIQILFAEVDLTTTEEFGVEIGLQSPVLFQRSVIPALPFLGAGTINFANATGGLVPPGVTVNSTINPAAQPGFNFNNVSLPLGNNPVVGPGTVGFQGLTNLGVGRVSPTSGVGGFVFSAASDTFNLLVRALKTQGRIDILSRPQIQTLDNQTAYMNIGQSVPYVNGNAVSATGLVTNLVNYRDVGVILQVTPRISPDNTILMRIIPEVSSVSPTQISLGNGQLATEFNVQHFETTVFARDGETIVIGGLIQKRDNRTENKVPVLGDVPYLGALFRYRTQDKSKTELLVILTPHIVRSPLDVDKVLSEESQRMDWITGDVSRIQGVPPLGSSKCPPPPRPLLIPGLEPPPAMVPGAPAPVPAPAAPEAQPRELLPPPRRQPAPAQPATPGTPGQPPGATGPAAALLDNGPAAAAPATATSASTSSTPDGQPAVMDAAAPPKEKKTWKWFRSRD